MYTVPKKDNPAVEQNTACTNACRWLFSADTCLRIGVLLCLGAVITGLWWFFEYVKIAIAMSLTWIQQIGLFYGSIALATLIIIQALLFLPCLPFTLGAGFLYGCVTGSIIVHIASTIAAFLGFMLSRYIARGCLEKRLMSKSGDSTWRKIDQAIEQDGFKLVFLIRFSPLHPYGLCNYLFGLTSVSLRDYMLGSFLGMMPTTIVEVYFGTAIKSFADIVGDSSSVAAETVEDSNNDSGAFFWFGLAATLAVTIYMTVWIKRKLNTHLDGYQHVGSDVRDVEMLELGSPTDSETLTQEELEDDVSDTEQDMEEDGSLCGDNEPEVADVFEEGEHESPQIPTLSKTARPVHTPSKPGSVPVLAPPTKEPESVDIVVSGSSSTNLHSTPPHSTQAHRSDIEDRRRTSSIAYVSEERPYSYADVNASPVLSSLPSRKAHGGEVSPSSVEIGVA